MLHQFGTTCNQDSRRTFCAWLLQWTDTHSVRLDDGLRKEILDGFPKGDDVFDAVVGLFGMLKVRLGLRRRIKPFKNVTLVGPVETLRM